MILTAAGRVHRADPPPPGELTTLARTDYVDAFHLDVAPAGQPSPESWARAILEGLPAVVRHTLRTGWRALGLKLDTAPVHRRILGWEIRASTPEHVLLGANSRIGMPAELLLRLDERGVVFSTCVEQDNRAARLLWAAVKPIHVPVLRSVLAHTAHRTGT